MACCGDIYSTKMTVQLFYGPYEELKWWIGLYIACKNRGFEH